MAPSLTIHPLTPADLPTVTDWARQEGFTPGFGDVAIDRQNDRQGVWVAWLGSEPVGCIASVRYNAAYGFIGLFLVVPEQRGKGYGVQLWRHALHRPGGGAGSSGGRHGLGVRARTSSARPPSGRSFTGPGPGGVGAGAPLSVVPAPEVVSLAAPPPAPIWRLVGGATFPEQSVQRFDAQREPSPRSHVLHRWLHHPSGMVQALVDQRSACHGFERLRPCLLQEGLLQQHPGVVLIKSSLKNPAKSARIGQLPIR